MPRKNILVAFLLVFSMVILFFQLYFKRERFLISYDYHYFADKYLHSQYVEGEGSKYIISDYELYSYAGHFYITGGDISRVNFENPPFGKYLIGTSILLFNNPLVIYLSYAAVYLLAAYKFGLLIFKDKIVALLGLMLLVSDPYFIHMATYAHLDFPMATFFLVGLYFFLTAKKWQQEALACFFFGLALASKFFPFLGVIVVYLLWYRGKNDKGDKKSKRLIRLAMVTPVIFVTYALTYTQYFLHHSLSDFLRYQWWVVRWRMGNPIVVGNILQSVFFGRLTTWWEKVPSYHYWREEWSPMLPAIIVISLISAVWFRKNELFRFIYGYMLLFFLYICFFTEGGLKYLAPLYPFFTLFTSALIIHVVSWGMQKAKSNM